MKEIEILVKLLDSKEKALSVLEQFTSHGIKRILDIYFYDPLRSDLKPDADGRLRRCLRLRQKEGNAVLTYKNDDFDNNDQWTFSDEHETSIGDFNTVLHIIEDLGFKELIRIDNEKYTYSTPDYEIVFEDVKDLGSFLEVEKMHEVADSEITQTKENIRKFINELGLKTSPELNAGKPELMLAKMRKNQIR